MIEQIKNKVFSMKIKENIKDVLSEDELQYLGTSNDEDILEVINNYVTSNIDEYDLSEVVKNFFNDLGKFETYQDCLQYYIEKNAYLNGVNSFDRVDDFIDKLQENESFVELVKSDYLNIDNKLF